LTARRLRYLRCLRPSIGEGNDPCQDLIGGWHGGNVGLQHPSPGGVGRIVKDFGDCSADGSRRTCIRRHDNAGTRAGDLVRVGELISSHRQADLRQSLRQSAQHGARTGVGNDGDAIFQDQRLRYERSNSNMRWQRFEARGIDAWTSCHNHVVRQIACRVDRLCQQLRHVERRAKSEIDRLLVRQMAHGLGQFLTRMNDAHFGTQR
jgi:hypothetical protein